MEDDKIINLFWIRSQSAIEETNEKYGKLCKTIAKNILHNEEDTEECINDTYLGVWNAIPNQRPQYFRAFLCKITRNLALKRYEYNTAKKRSDQIVSSLEELAEMIDTKSNIEKNYESAQLGKLISSYLRTIPLESCNLFVRRYWYYDSIKELSVGFGMSESKVKSSLFRTRNKLKEYLEKEGIVL